MLPDSDDPEPHDEPQKSQLSQEFRHLIDGLRREVSELREEVSALRRGDQTDDLNALYTRGEAAEILRISTRKLDDLEAAGRLKAVRIGNRVLYHPENLQAFIRAQTREGGQ